MSIYNDDTFEFPSADDLFHTILSEDAKEYLQYPQANENMELIIEPDVDETK